MDFSTVLNLIIQTIWLMLPASLSNTAAAVGIYLFGQGKPIDLGKCWNNNRILGDGKTFQGLFYGITFGILLGIIELFLSKYLNLPQFSWVAVIALPMGALLGDMIASFFKRRLNIKRGALLPFVDQLDFVFGAWILTITLDYNWFVQNFSLPVIITTLLIIPIFHLIFNIVGYKIGVSKEPW